MLFLLPLFVMLVGELITATMLYAQAAVFRSRALAVLGAGYVYTALLIIPHALTFPGAFAPDGLLGAGRRSGDERSRECRGRNGQLENTPVEHGKLLSGHSIRKPAAGAEKQIAFRRGKMPQEQG